MSHILLIEDEPNVADNLVYALKTEGFQVDWQGTGADGLARLADEAFDLVVLDIGLPDMDGFGVCREIRKTSNIPVLFLTARDGEIDRIVGLEIGGDDYVTKPFSPREVTARIKAILRRTGASSPPSNDGDATVTGFEIDEDRFEIRWRCVLLELTRYEFRLLACFAQSPGRVFTRDNLMERVWEDPGASTERTVDTHVKRLRAKLREVDPEVDPIQTVRGIGYTMRVS